MPSRSPTLRIGRWPGGRRSGGPTWSSSAPTGGPRSGGSSSAASRFRPRSPEHPEDETFPGLLLLRPEGRLFFANAEHFAQKMRPLIAAVRPKVVAIDCRAVFDVEYTALRMLTDAEQKRREEGVLLWLVGLNPRVLEVIQRSPLGRTLGRERMFFNLEQAVARYLASQAVEPAPLAVV